MMGDGSLTVYANPNFDEAVLSTGGDPMASGSSECNFIDCTIVGMIKCK